MRPARRRNFAHRTLATAAALTLSVAAHLALLAALSIVGTPPQPPPRLLEIELVEVPAVRSPADTSPATPSPRAFRVPGSRSGTRAPVDSPPRGAATPPPYGSPAVSHGIDLGAEGLAVSPAERAAPDLRPRLAPGPIPGPGLAAGAKEGTNAYPLSRWAAELAGRARAESGLAHPYCNTVGKALAREWDAESAVKARGVSGYLANVGDSLKTFGRTWVGMAEGYGRTGAPGLIDGGSDRVRELAGLPAGPGRDAMLQTEVVRQLRRAWSEGT